MRRYYAKYFPNSKFIIINDDISSRLLEIKDVLTEKDEFYFYENFNNYERCKCINFALSLIDTQYVCIQDTDCIVNIDSFKDVDRYLNPSIKFSNKIYGCYIPYNGTFIDCQIKEVLNKFSDSLDYSVFEESYKDKCFIPLNHGESRNGFYNMGSNSVGGCLIYKTSDLKEVGGYNIKFVGWGYEDNEIQKRMNRLTSKGSKNLFHLSHFSNSRSQNPNLYSNKKIYDETMNLKDAKSYRLLIEDLIKRNENIKVSQFVKLK